MTVSPALPASACPSAAPERYEPRTFLGYACEDDCQGHKAGFAWAVRHRVAATRSCDALRRAEAEGCRAYVEEALPADTAGYRWAIENEVTDACLCIGAGEGFLAGCSAAIAIPMEASGSVPCAEAWPGCAEMFHSGRPGR